MFTFADRRRNAPSPTSVADLMPGAGLQMLRDDAEDLAADVDAVDRVDVQAIETGQWREARRPLRARAIEYGRP